MMKFAALLLLAIASPSFAAEGEAHSCACEAEEFGFDIDCDNDTQMLDALAALKAAGCGSDCSAEGCEKNFLIIQSHHDYCPEDGIPKDVEDDFHDFDEVCTACEISRLFVEGAPNCPAPQCEDESGNTAYQTLLDEGCLADCSSDACKENFFTLRVTHDLCDHDVLSRTSEEGLHDMEDSCDMHICNIEGAETMALVCDEHDHDHEDEHDDHEDEHDDHDDHEDEHGHSDDHSDDHSDHDEAKEDPLGSTSGAAAAGMVGVSAMLSAALVMMS